MSHFLIKYEDPPLSKNLPSMLCYSCFYTVVLTLILARGTLFDSHPKAVGFHWITWAIANVTLFLSPTIGLITWISMFGVPSGLQQHSSVQELAYFFAYIGIYFGIHLVFIGESNISAPLTTLIPSIASLLFPDFFRYHLIPMLLCGRRRHRSHFSFMSFRRLRKVTPSSFTLFVLGLGTLRLTTPVRTYFSRYIFWNLTKYSCDSQHNNVRYISRSSRSSSCSLSFGFSSLTLFCAARGTWTNYLYQQLCDSRFSWS
jgi:hypothetical protein